MAPMYAHLGRYPKPLSLMHEHRVHVLLRVELMNRPDPDFSAANDTEEDFFSSDEIPETPLKILRHLAIDFVPETRAVREVIDEWVEAQSELEAGTKAESSVDDMATFDVEGQRITAGAQPRSLAIGKIMHS